MNKPTFEQAQKDYSEIKDELTYMNNIRDNAMLLSLKIDVNAPFYRNIIRQVEVDISNGQRVLDLIKEGYPEVS
jgi:hypothetical protein